MEYIDKGAILSKDQLYRYRLWREWGPKRAYRKKACLFIMLNPSTADGSEDDPTIRRCVSFASRFEYERLEVVNLFAFRATDPKELKALSKETAIGPRNRAFVQRWAGDAGLIILGWGAHGSLFGHNETVCLEWLKGQQLNCLGFTAAGLAKHPLYVKGDAPLIRITGGN